MLRKGPGSNPADHARTSWRRARACSGLTSRLILAYVEREGGRAAIDELLVRTEMSSREAELLGHVVVGAPTRDIAKLMFVSEHTVQDHLKSIFSKTGTHTRRDLLARILRT